MVAKRSPEVAIPGVVHHRNSQKKDGLKKSSPIETGWGFLSIFRCQINYHSSSNYEPSCGVSLWSLGQIQSHGDGRHVGYTRRLQCIIANPPDHALHFKQTSFVRHRWSWSTIFGWLCVRYMPTTWRSRSGRIILFASCAWSTRRRSNTCF
jgi:hypothetical protein